MIGDVVVVGRVVEVVGGVVGEVVLVVAVDVIWVVVVFEESGLEFEKPKPIPRPTPVNSNIIDNDARINLLTTKKSRYLSSIHRYSLDKCQIGKYLYLIFFSSRLNLLVVNHHSSSN